MRDLRQHPLYHVGDLRPSERGRLERASTEHPRVELCDHPACVAARQPSPAGVVVVVLAFVVLIACSVATGALPWLNARF